MSVLSKDVAPRRVLAGLSSAPSNAKIIETAAKMAEAFGATFTALYVRTPAAEKMSESDEERLAENVALAERSGATVVTLYGDDVAFQIAQYARISGATEIVVGQSAATSRGFFGKPTLVNRLISMLPEADVHIIPDAETALLNDGKKRFSGKRKIFSIKDALVAVAMLALATAVGFAFSFSGFTEANIITAYILAVLIVSVFTDSRICWGFTAVASVLLFNFFFTAPKFSLIAYGKEYPLTFLTMFLAAFITGSIASKMREQAKEASRTAYRTKILFEANGFLRKAGSEEEAAIVTAERLSRFLGKRVAYVGSDGKDPAYFGSDGGNAPVFSESDGEEIKNMFYGGENVGKKDLANWTVFPVSTGERIYGAFGVYRGGKNPDPFESGIITAVAGECALAIDVRRTAKDKERAAVAAENERTRANLLRSISHDLRTPLTSISGNANNLLSGGEKLDEETKKSIYADIAEDARWLYGLVENVLALTKIEGGLAKRDFQAELIDDVITEALSRIDVEKTGANVSFAGSGEMLFADMDAKLIMQVVINLVENSLKYSPAGSPVVIKTESDGNFIRVTVSDYGNGVPDEEKEKIFGMFYTGSTKVTDGRRSLGLGLFLCKTIIEAHGGKIKVSDNEPKGSAFTFTLPKSEVETNE